MNSKDKSNSSFEYSPSTMVNNPGCYATSQIFLHDPSNRHNNLELCFHTPNSMNYYPPVSSSINSNGHVASSTSSSAKIYGLHPREVSSIESDWYGTNATDYSGNSWITLDITLDYINKLLMQEDSDDRVKLHHGENALRAMEEPFYELLGQNNPVHSHRLPLCNCDHLKNIDDNISNSCSICHVAVDPCTTHSNHNLQVFQAPWRLSDIVKEKKQFAQGTLSMELGLNVDGLSVAEKRSQHNQSLQVNVANKSKHTLFEVHSGTYSRTEDFQLLEGRSIKQFAVSFNGITRDEMLDRVLLFSEHKHTHEDNVLQEMMTNNSTKNSKNVQGTTSACRKTRVKKQHKKEVVDLRTLLIHCAEEVSVNNYTSASDILNTVRQHSSVSGDDTQRLASCLADCLEVRLMGTGGQVYHKLKTETFSNVVDLLKVYQLSLTISPFMRAPYYFSNKTILDVSKGKQKVHIIDFGIHLGFQWPSLFEQLASRKDGPPKVRITGIDLPQPGFRPNQINKNTGQLLADYASMFNMPFEYKGISSKWETIRIEDLNIEEDEVLIVNCIFRMKNLGDETVSLNSARNRVLNTIRMMKPKVFVHGVVNGSYSTPFFLPRFKEVMYHYSTYFDILDKTVPRDNEARMFIERISQCQLLNVIACEGSERTERPENYKKWKSRNLNAGFELLPLNPDIVKVIREMVGKYHKDYVINEDDQWLLLEWKGRILNAISTWKPSESYDGE